MRDIVILMAFISVQFAILEKVIAVNVTSGTTGIPTFYTFTQHDIQVTNECLQEVYGG